jgi:hypothetical protein
MSQTVGIITMAKNEHDFINPWIEYHYKLGFSHFYILVDNIDSIQPKYIIDEKYNKFVSLITANDDDITQYFDTNFINSECHNSKFLHELLNHKIIYKNLINEDWITAVGIDQYIYMNGDTIQNYLLNIDNSCDQIMFPWSFALFNNTDSNYDNFLENIQLYNIFFCSWSGTSNGMIKTKNLKKIALHSHSYDSITEFQKIYIFDEYFIFKSDFNIYDIFDIMKKKMLTNSFDKFKISSFHILLRNINECYIKKLFSWNTDETNNSKIILDLVNSINNNITDYKFDGRNIIPCEKNEKQNNTLIDINPYLLELKIPELECKNSSEHYDNLIFKKLEMYNISKEKFDNWKKNTFINDI